MKRFFAWITALLMLLSLAACSSTQTSTAAASQQASTSETGKSENELIAEENDILAANNALWEKVFASMDKNVTDTTLSSNYGDILMSALDHAKDQFTDEEYAVLKADADKIREIETQIAALPQDEAASQSMTQTASTFPQFEGKDLDGNSVSSSLFADNAFTVVNFWFSGCKPCVDEMDDLNALNQRIQEQGGEVIGTRVRVKVVKNKIAPPFKEAEFDIMFGKGISREGDILDLAAKDNIIEKSGAWFAYNGSKIGQGRENAKQYLADNPDILAEVEEKVRTKYGLAPSHEGLPQREEEPKLLFDEAGGKK